MTALETYAGSDGKATRELYDRLAAMGPAGVIAMNLFRACKCSERAKVYRGGCYRREAYGRKEWSLKNLCNALVNAGDALGIMWGWKLDPTQACHKWVLYVDIPTGQVSFHAAERMCAQEYAKEWDGKHESSNRIVQWCAELLGEVNRDWASPAPCEARPAREVQTDFGSFTMMFPFINDNKHDSIL